MPVDKNVAMKVWKDIFGDKEWASDCFGNVMCIFGYGNDKYLTKGPGADKTYDYSWNVDHIRPKSNFENESDADFYNNYEPVHRLNNSEKSDDFPHFEVNGNKYMVVRCDIPSKENRGGYGIVDSNGNRVDWKGKQNRYY